jgi:hypothetical protein
MSSLGADTMDLGAGWEYCACCEVGMECELDASTRAIVSRSVSREVCFNTSSSGLARDISTSLDQQIR